MQKNIFEQDDEGYQDKEKTKPKTVMVKKKKKKVNKVTPIETEHQNGLSSIISMMNKMVITPNSANQQDIKVYNVANKSYEQMINLAKKPRRMPPPQIQTLIQKQQEIYSSSQQEGEPELIFHKPGTNIINNKNKKKKPLFGDDKQTQSLDMEEQFEGVFYKLKREKIKKALEEQRAREKLKVRPKTKEQLMIEFLKSKYNKNEDYLDQQLKLASAVVQTQFPQIQSQLLPPPTQSQYSSPYASRLAPTQYSNTNVSQYQAQTPTQSYPQQQYQSPPAYGSQYPSQYTSHYQPQQLPQYANQNSNYPNQYPYQYNNQYANQSPYQYPNQTTNQFPNKYPNQNQSQYTLYPNQTPPQSYPPYTPQFSPQNQPQYQNQTPSQQLNHQSLQSHFQP